MSNVIYVNFGSENSVKKERTINSKILENSRESILKECLKPASGDVEFELAEDHTPEPIKSLGDINRISEYLISNKRYRDNMLFIVGINFGLRISDLLRLRFTNLIDDNFKFRTTFPILEQKTKNTRKVRKNRYITINEAVMDAVTLYIQNNDGCKLDDYMFRSESNNGSNINEPLSRMAVHRILKEISETLSLNIKISSHTLRKTFAYHQMVMSNNDPRKLLLLQKILGHSSISITLDYIGITYDEIQEAYLNLNLGSNKNYLINSTICENEILPVS